MNTNTKQDANTAEQVEKAKELINDDGCAVIHCEYFGRISNRRCFNKHIISVEQWRKMTEESERKFWKARAQYAYTKKGYLAVQWSRRRWGDGAKVIDTWKPCEVVPSDFVAIDRDIDEVIKEA